MRIGFMMPFDKKRLKFAHEAGFGSAELMVNPDDPFFPGQSGWRKKANEVREAFAEKDLRISTLGAFYLNHMDSRQAAEGRKRVRGSIRLAEYLGVPVVAGFAGRVMDKPLEESLPRFKKLWSDHAGYAESKGIRIALEHCPMGKYHLPPGGINCICTPEMWRRCFEEVASPALGLEWDPSHLVCQFIDPIVNLREFGSRVYHVHAKDAHINRDLLARQGVWSGGTVEHCFPGLGDTDWGLVIKELLRQGYPWDLNIEGRHDDVYRDRPRGAKREDDGLSIALKTLSPFVDGK